MSTWHITYTHADINYQCWIDADSALMASVVFYATEIGDISDMNETEMQLPIRFSEDKRDELINKAVSILCDNQCEVIDMNDWLNSRCQKCIGMWLKTNKPHPKCTIKCDWGPKNSKWRKYMGGE